MQKYEINTIISASLSEEDREKEIAKYSKMIEADNGKILQINKIGVKKLAYPINYKSEGYYVVFEFEAEPALPNKIESLMRIDEHILRNLCIKKA